MPTIPDASAPPRSFAATDADLPAIPIYRPGDPPLPFCPNLRHAAIDVMILTFAARRHSAHLAGMGSCPDDLASLIRGDLQAIERALQPSPPTTDDSGVSAHVGPRAQPPPGGELGTPGLFDATRPNVGQPPEGGAGSSGGASVAEMNGSSVADGAP